MRRHPYYGKRLTRIVVNGALITNTLILFLSAKIRHFLEFWTFLLFEIHIVVCIIIKQKTAQH